METVFNLESRSSFSIYTAISFKVCGFRDSQAATVKKSQFNSRNGSQQDKRNVTLPLFRHFYLHHITPRSIQERESEYSHKKRPAPHMQRSKQGLKLGYIQPILSKTKPERLKHGKLLFNFK